MPEVELLTSERQVLLGSLLGDGRLNLGKRYINAYYFEVHSIRQRKYLEWKAPFLKKFHAKIGEHTATSRGKTYSKCHLWTRVSPYLTQLHSELYPNGRKIVLPSVLSELNPLGLAIWFCDDGSYRYRNKSACLCTDGYDFSSQVVIQSWLQKIWGISSNVVKSGPNYRIDCSPIAAKKLINLIAPHIPNCMRYKVGEDVTKIEHAKAMKKIADQRYYRKKVQRLLSLTPEGSHSCRFSV